MITSLRVEGRHLESCFLCCISKRGGYPICEFSRHIWDVGKKEVSSFGTFLGSSARLAEERAVISV